MMINRIFQYLTNLFYSKKPFVIEIGQISASLRCLINQYERLRIMIERMPDDESGYAKSDLNDINRNICKSLDKILDVIEETRLNR
jgi:hypothetical protein